MQNKMTHKNPSTRCNHFWRKNNKLEINLDVGPSLVPGLVTDGIHVELLENAPGDHVCVWNRAVAAVHSGALCMGVT